MENSSLIMLGIGVVAGEIILVMFITWVIKDLLNKLFKGQNTIMQFMVKEYQDRQLAKVQERTEDRQDGAKEKIKALKAIGIYLKDEIKAGSIFNNFSKIIASLTNGIMPNGKELTPETSTSPGTEDQPAPARKPNPNAIAALKAANERRKAEASAKANQAG